MYKSHITKVSNKEWLEAQKYESNTWTINNKRNSLLKFIYKYIKLLKIPKLFFKQLQFRDFYCGDDWNYWWMEKFDYYKLIPNKIENALEVGSGPYSNIRLISKLKKIKKIFCTDPLMDEYKTFKMTWVAEMARKEKIVALTGRCEEIDFKDNYFDLLVCNNVLDHVENVDKCFLEMYRVLKPGGYFIYSQDLTDDKEISRLPKREGHPIRLNHVFLDNNLKEYEIVYKKILPREESRSEEYYGTYVFIGQKKSQKDSKAIITSSSNKFYPSVLNLIGSIKENYPNHPDIYVYDLGLNFIFKKQLDGIPGVTIIKMPNFVPFWKSCYTWKPYIFKNPIADLCLYLDAGMQVLRPLDELYEKIKSNEYLIVEAGNEVKNIDIIPSQYIEMFDLKEDLLNKNIIAAGIFGFKKDSLLIKEAIDKIFHCATAGLCLGFSSQEQWKNKGINKNQFIRDARYFRHDNTLFCIFINKYIENPIIEPTVNFESKRTNNPQQYIWIVRLNFKKLDFTFNTLVNSGLFIRVISIVYIRSFFILKEINRIIKRNNYV